MEVNMETEIKDSITEDKKPEGLNAKIDKMLENQSKLLGEKKVKSWKLPFSGRLGKAQLKKNFVTVMYIKDNKSVDFIKVPIDQETVTIDGLPRASSADYVLSYKGKPMIIQPSWSVAPFAPKESIVETEAQGLSSKARKLVFAKMKNDIIIPPKKGGGMMIWIILIAAVAGIGFYLVKGGKLF